MLSFALVLCAARCIAQPVAVPPDFGVAQLAPLSEAAAKACNDWVASDPGLEAEVFRIPMAEARARAARSLVRALDCLDRRDAYARGVASAIDQQAAAPQPQNTPIAADPVVRDRLEVLGLHSVAMQRKLDRMRDAPEWSRVRRSVQPGRSELEKLQASAREEIPFDQMKAAAVSTPVSSIVYRDSERQMRDVLRRLWTAYYQALADAAEQKPQGSAPLLAAAGEPAAPAVSAQQGNLTGAWSYVPGGGLFNGVAEPRRVLLELWMENGLLAGRYRAELPHFDGPRTVDLRLREQPAGGPGRTFEFESKDPPASGRLVVEGPDAGGVDLMAIRVPAAAAKDVIPPGREMLHRR